MKRIFSLIFTCCLIFMLISCGISEEQYQEVCAERDSFQAELQEVKQEMEEFLAQEDPIPVTIRGTFTAHVRSLIPGYVVDNETIMVAIVTPFQDGPFALYIGEMAEQLEVGKTYVFEVEPRDVTVTRQEYERGLPFFTEAIERYYLHVSSWRIAGEEDYGLETTHLVFEMR